MTGFVFLFELLGEGAMEWWWERYRLETEGRGDQWVGWGGERRYKLEGRGVLVYTFTSKRKWITHMLPYHLPIRLGDLYVTSPLEVV